MEPDKTPSITQNVDASIWIVWASRRIQDQLDLYYRKGMELHDIAVLSVSYSASHGGVAFRGEKIYVEVGIQNNGEAKEPFVEVRCYVNSSMIGSRVTALLYGQYFSMVFEWNTDPKAKPGRYVVSAEVTPVLGEVNVGDNIRQVVASAERMPDMAPSGVLICPPRSHNVRGPGVIITSSFASCAILANCSSSLSLSNVAPMTVEISLCTGTFRFSNFVDNCFKC
jgi:hypothetical protein